MISYIPLIVILAGLAVMAFFLIKNKKVSHSQREELAKKMGWDYYQSASVSTIADKGKKNLYFRITGNIKEHNWGIDSFIRFQSDNVFYSPYSTFTSGKKYIGSHYFFMVPNQKNPKTPAVDYLQYFEKINENRLSKVLGIDMDLVRKLTVYEDADEITKSNYVIYLSSQMIADQIMNEDFINKLHLIAGRNHKKAEMPFVSITPQALQLKINKTLEKCEEIKEFAELGTALLQGLL